MDIDLTDYVDLAARVWVNTSTSFEYDRLPEMVQFNARESMLPVVEAIIDAYVKAHPEADLDWLKGLG